jgi:hypothetical protein
MEVSINDGDVKAGIIDSHKSFEMFPNFKRHQGNFGYQELTIPILPTSSMEMAIDLINNL